MPLQIRSYFNKPTADCNDDFRMQGAQRASVAACVILGVGLIQWPYLRNRAENFPEVDVLRAREFPLAEPPITLAASVFTSLTVSELSPDDSSHERNQIRKVHSHPTFAGRH